jgi:hypothetical protein
MNTLVLQDFSYDPFDPAVMADPLPYYGVLRDEHPVYFIDKWDTYALSRFSDIWQVLEINDGTFVASEGTLPAATVLGRRNDGPVPDLPLHPMPFHANFDAPIYDGVRRCTARPFRPKSVSQLADRICRPDAGVRRHRRRVGGAEMGFQMITLASESQALRRGAADHLNEATGRPAL